MHLHEKSVSNSNVIFMENKKVKHGMYDTVLVMLLF